MPAAHISSSAPRPAGVAGALVLRVLWARLPFFPQAVAPRARLAATSFGSTESNQSLVPAAITDCNGVVAAMTWFLDGDLWCSIRPRLRFAGAKRKRMFYSDALTSDLRLVTRLRISC